MSSFLINIFDWLRRHRVLRSLFLVLATSILILLLIGQNYKEDISDFLPLNNKYQKALQVYQNISGADNIIAIFQCKDSTKVDPDLLTEAIESYIERLDGVVDDDFKKGIMTGVDIEKFANITDFTYHHIPYFLTDDDYARIDSLLGDSTFVSTQIGNVKQMLMFPASGLLAENLQRDPLNIFTPIVAKLQPSSTAANYELYDGYIFSPDLKVALVVMKSPHGASETNKNTALLSVLEQVGHDTEIECPEVNVSLFGAPVISVGNSRQIKNDSVISVILAVVLIIILLFVVFRNFRNMLLIVLSIGWGWLFAMGMLALFHNNVSVIVIGISSVILGIAVNYPLHLIAHLNHTPDVKTALKEIVMPLVVGNITTVGAFLALVPLKSVALRDLGLFSSFLLIGTIVFVLLFLPHLVSVSNRKETRNIFSRFGDFSFENKPWIVWCVTALTLFFAYFSLHTSFDSNISHINYMTDDQKSDLATLQKMMSQEQTGSIVYVVSSDSTLEGALQASESMLPSIYEMKNEKLISKISVCHQFLFSETEQEHRLLLWNDFISRHALNIENAIIKASQAEGFSESTFSDFIEALNRSYAVLPSDSFNILHHTALSSYLIADSVNHRYDIVELLTTEKENLKLIEDRLDQIDERGYSFDVSSMNSSMATSISDDFNYIGWVCGLIVFIFLWLSLGNIELAILSFLPMAISWVWILGIMSLLNIQFNVVNVILATFIFGQGDDYTIFMTEGCQYEYAYHKKLLPSYKNSIIVSALIMFIGIGTLIFARHPALHSLAEVTIVGMFSVVLMACIFPPLIFKWMVSYRTDYRMRPFAIIPFFITCYCAIVFFSQLVMAYILGFVLFVIKRPTKESKAFFHKYTKRCFSIDMKRIATTKFTIVNPHGESFSKPSIIICNHQSMLDTAYLMSISEKIVIVSNENASKSRIIKPVFNWLDNYTLSEGESLDDDRISRLLSEGYSVVIFPEGKRNPDSSILRFHKGAFYLAEKNQVDILPLFIHGVNHIFPRNSLCTYPGEVTISIGSRIKPDDTSWGDNYAMRTKTIHKFYVSEYDKLRKGKETAEYFRKFVSDRYRYKGIEVSSAVAKRIRKYDAYSQWVDGYESQHSEKDVIIMNSGYGEFALMLALCHPEKNVFAIESDEDKYLVAKHSSEQIAKNLIHLHASDTNYMTSNMHLNEAVIYLVEPSAEEEKKYQKYNPIIIKK